MTPTSPVPANPPQGSVPSYRPVSMNWFILKAAQNSRILSVGATPVLLFTSCLTPFVELLNGATQASRNLVNFQFTRSMKSLTSAFWYSIANVPMGIIAVATTPFDKGRWARNSYPASMIPGDARSPAHLPTQVIDKDAIERDIKREADLKEQVAILRDLLTTEQNKKLDLRLGYEAQFAKALELIGKRIAQLQIAADAETLEDACNEIYEGAINSLWNLLSKKHQNVVNDRYPSGELKAKYELVSQIIATEYQNTSTELNRHVNNTINLIATLARIDTIPLDSTPDQGFALIDKLVQKLSEAEKQEFQTVKEFANQIQYLFAKLSAAALKKAGDDAVAKENLVVFHQKFQENLELLNKTTENLEKTQKALDAQTQLLQEAEQKLLEVTNNYNAAKSRLEELEKDLPKGTQELIAKIQNLEQQQANAQSDHEQAIQRLKNTIEEKQQLIAAATQELQVQHQKAMNDLKLEHEQAIQRLTKTIEENEQLIDQAGNKTLEFTTTIEEQKEQIIALEEQHAREIKELKEAHTLATIDLTNEKTTQINLMTDDHQQQIGKIKTQLTNLQQEHEKTVDAVTVHLEAVAKLTRQIESLKNEHIKEINELNLTHQTALKTATDKETQLTQQIAELKLEHQEILKENEATLTELTKLHREKIEQLTKDHQTAQQKAVNDKEEELTNQIDQLNQTHQTVKQNNETSLNQLRQEQENTVKANTTLQQQLEESKKAVAQSQERALQLENKNKEQLILIENLKNQLAEFSKVTEENQNNLSLPTPVIPSEPETKKEVPEEATVANELTATTSPKTPPNSRDVAGFAATGIDTPKTAPKVLLQEMTNSLSLLSQLFELLAKADNNLGSAMKPKPGHRLSIKAHQGAKAIFSKLKEGSNSNAVQALIQQWDELSPLSTGKTKALELTVDQFTKFQGAVKAAQEAEPSSV